MKEEINTRELAYIQIISSWKRQMILVANPYIVLTRCQALVQSALQMWLHQALRVTRVHNIASASQGLRVYLIKTCVCIKWLQLGLYSHENTS